MLYSDPVNHMFIDYVLSSICPVLVLCTEGDPDHVGPGVQRVVRAAMPCPLHDQVGQRTSQGPTTPREGLGSRGRKGGSTEQADNYYP